MLESRAGEIQNFATEIIEKVTLGAMDIADAKSEDAVAGLPLSDARSVGCGRCGDPKSRNRSLRLARRSSSERSKKKCSCDGGEKSENLEMTSSSDTNDVDYAKVIDDKTSEEIRKIVEGLRGVRIGDSKLVGPAERVTNLEKQIKRAVVEMQNAPRQITETNIEGNAGDARNFSQTITDSGIEAIPEAEQRVPVKIAKLEDRSEKRKTESQTRLSRQGIEPEVLKLRSTCFLHRMIRELEDAEANRVNLLAGPATTPPVATNAASMSAVSQERIAAWEECEERFIRTIEGSKEDDEETSVLTEIPSTIETSFAIYPLENVPVKEAVVLDVQIEEPEFKPIPRTATPGLISSIDLPADQPLETTESIMPAEQTPQGTIERSKSKVKKNLAARLRRFFRSGFKRSKD